MAECIYRQEAIDSLLGWAAQLTETYGKNDEYVKCLESAAYNIEQISAADVLPRDEAIKMWAELAAMHGSDATSQQLEEAYLKGVEDGMTRRDVRPVVFCRDCKHSEPWYADKLRCFLWHESGIDVFNDGFCNYGVKREKS